MKKLVLAALLSIGMVGFAQNRSDKEKMTPEQRNEKRLEKMTSELNLTTDQQKQVGDLFASQSAEMEKMKADRKKNRSSKPTAAERDAMKKQMEARNAENDAKMKAILTPDQNKKYLANQEKQKQKMHDRKGDHKKGGNHDDEMDMNN